jgi:hypothetical protein
VGCCHPGISSSLQAVKGELYRSENPGNETVSFPFQNVTAADAATCPALLCKVRPAAQDSCNVYKVR